MSALTSGNLWSSTGTLLGTATFSGEPPPAGSRLTLRTPVAITADTTYVVSYHTDTGFYSADACVLPTTPLPAGR